VLYSGHQCISEEEHWLWLLASREPHLAQRKCFSYISNVFAILVVSPISRAVEPGAGNHAILDGWSRSQKCLMVQPEPEIWVPVPQTYLWGKRVLTLLQWILVFNQPNCSGSGAKKSRCLEPQPEILSSGSTALAIRLVKDCVSITFSKMRFGR